MPTHDVLNERLSEYLDNELDAAGRAEVEAHLAECGECRADLQAVAAVVARAGTLTDAAPAENLWPRIEARIAPAQVLRPTFARRRFAFTMPQLIAAGVALTIRSLETTLHVIDRAIGQCREALAADPANVYLNTYLAETRRRKLELLRRATALVDQAM